MQTSHGMWLGKQQRGEVKENDQAPMFPKEQRGLSLTVNNVFSQQTFVVRESLCDDVNP